MSNKTLLVDENMLLQSYYLASNLSPTHMYLNQKINRVASSKNVSNSVCTAKAQISLDISYMYIYHIKHILLVFIRTGL